MSHSYNSCLFSCFGPAGRRIPVNQDMDKGFTVLHARVPLAEYAAQEQEED